MLTMRRESLARCAAAVLVIGGHALLIVLLWRSHPRPAKGDAGVPNRGTLVMLELRRLPDQPSAVAPEHTRAGVMAPRAQLRLPSAQPGAPPALDTAIQALPVKPPIDWYREAEIVAREAGARVLPPARTDCDEVPRPGSLRPKCRKDAAEFLWDPEPRRFGIEGGIPYVRVGPCVVALIAFGCGIGKADANGELFKDMRHPDRPTSSVPDVNEGDR
jgi:hypothetical protein